MRVLWAKVNKYPYVRLINTLSYDAYSIPVHVRTMNLSDISQKQREENPEN